MAVTQLMPEQGQVLHLEPHARLTRREVDVLTLLARGHTSAGVAEILFLSKRTVDFHSANIFHKLGASNRMQALRAAEKLGFLPFEPTAAA